jgi:hypothetical protein
LAVFSRYIDAETCPVSPDAVTAKRGAKAPPATLDPLGWLRARTATRLPRRARTATRLPRRPGHARGRLQEQGAGGSRPGGRHDGSRPHSSWTGHQIEHLPHYGHYIGSRRGSRLPRPSLATSNQCTLSSLRIRSSRRRAGKGGRDAAWLGEAWRRVRLLAPGPGKVRRELPAAARRCRDPAQRAAIIRINVAATAAAR